MQSFGAKPKLLYNLFSRILLNALSVDKNIYIGLRRSTTLRTEWTWVNNARATPGAILWFQGEPNNSGGREDCAEIRVKTPDIKFGWGTNDLPCSILHIGLCEKRLNQS